MPIERGALSVEEAAKYLSLGRTKMFELIRKGELQTIKIGRRRLVPLSALRRLLGEDA